FKNAVDAKDIILRQPRFSSNQCQASSLRVFWFFLPRSKKNRGSSVTLAVFRFLWGVQKEL
ncbi:MAG: hypothetical protein LBT55_04530, partial [Clostridiaceae bacterium]|nr:hypothetical protein [Clostridiaceae bacterium]